MLLLVVVGRGSAKDNAALAVSAGQWVGDAECSPVAHEPLVRLLAHILQRLQHFRLRLRITPLLELDGPIGDIERVCPPEQPTQHPLLLWPQFHGFRHVLLPRVVSERLESSWWPALGSHGVGSRTGLSASFASATATEVERKLLYLLARLGVDHDLAYRYPAIVAGVGAFVLVVVVGCSREGIAGWRYSVLVHSL